MARVEKETAPNRKIALSLGDNYYEIIKDPLSFSIQKRNGKGNIRPIGLYPSTFGRALEFVLNDAAQISEKEILTVREYINEIRSIYDQLREVKAEWQVIDKKAYDGNLGIPELPTIEESIEEEEDDEDEF